MKYHQPASQLLPLVPPILEEVDIRGKVVVGPDDGISIVIPEVAVADNENINIRIQTFVPTSTNAVSLPDNLKLLSPIYNISTFSKHFIKNVKLKMAHYASTVCSEVVFLCSEDASPPYRFKKLPGGNFNISHGTIFLKSFCKVSVGGPPCKLH